MCCDISAAIKVFDQEAFHGVDKLATGIAFDVHNEYGRHLAERLYQAELAQRLADHNLGVVRELKMTLTLGGFRKDYFADFLINGGVIVEVKAADALTRAHQAQVLNYLYICGLHHATLLNLRPERVQHEFVSTSLTHDQRRRITWNLTNWRPLCASCELLQTTLVRALESWGARLDIVAYREAVIHFLGGEAAVVKEVEVRSRHGMLGQQKMYLLSPEIGFWITAAGHCLGPALEHQRRFLEHTNLRAIQWVNLDGQTVTFSTINR